MYYLFAISLAVSGYILVHYLRFRRDASRAIAKTNKSLVDISQGLSSMIEAVKILNNKIESYNKENIKADEIILEFIKIHQDSINTLSIKSGLDYTQTILPSSSKKGEN